MKREGMRPLSFYFCGRSVVLLGGGHEGGRQSQLLYPTEPRSRSEKSAADAKLEKTSLSAGGFLRVPYGFGIGLWLHIRQAIIKNK